MLGFKYVDSLLDYNPSTGIFIWKVSKGSVKPGRIAGTKGIGRNGCYHWMIKIDRRFYYAHKLAWLLSHNEWPPSDLDHINGNGLDNRIDNLRLCTMSQNQANRKRNSNNTTGAKGVHQRKGGRFRAYISFQGRRINLGAFGTVAAASAARSAAAQRLFGEFARLK